MARLSKFLRLRSADRRLLLKTMLLVWTVRLGLWLLPFHVMRQLLAKLALKSASSQNGGRDLVDRDIWAVTVACRYVPLATCLTQALVTKVLLGRHGHHATVRIGVARSEEWQRLALARAFYRRAGILILDEPTSALDSWAEADWFDRFRSLANGRTAIIITHRFTIARRADMIHVMDAGRIVESGKHDELLSRGGMYARSWTAQLHGQALPVGEPLASGMSSSTLSNGAAAKV
jgi:hypothetical protein